MKRLIGLLVLVLALAVSVVGVLAQEEVTPEPTTPTDAVETVEATDETPLLGVQYDTSADVVEIRVMRGTPAEDAGLLDGDIITAVNGEAVTGATMADTVTAFAPGDAITLTVEREDETLDIVVTLDNLQNRRR